MQYYPQKLDLFYKRQLQSSFFFSFRKLYIFKESDDVGRSLGLDRQRKAKNNSKPG